MPAYVLLRERRYDEGRQNRVEDRAAVMRDVAAGVSAGLQLDFSIESLGKVYGYFTTNPPSYATLLNSHGASIDFFKK